MKKKKNSGCLRINRFRLLEPETDLPDISEAAINKNNRFRILKSASLKKNGKNQFFFWCSISSRNYK